MPLQDHPKIEGAVEALKGLRDKIPVDKLPLEAIRRSPRQIRSWAEAKASKIPGNFVAKRIVDQRFTGIDITSIREGLVEIEAARLRVNALANSPRIKEEKTFLLDSLAKIENELLQSLGNNELPEGETFSAIAWQAVVSEVRERLIFILASTRLQRTRKAQASAPITWKGKLANEAINISGLTILAAVVGTLGGEAYFSERFKEPALEPFNESDLTALIDRPLMERADPETLGSYNPFNIDARKNSDIAAGDNSRKRTGKPKRLRSKKAPGAKRRVKKPIGEPGSGVVITETNRTKIIRRERLGKAGMIFRSYPSWEGKLRGRPGEPGVINRRGDKPYDWGPDFADKGDTDADHKTNVGLTACDATEYQVTSIDWDQETWDLEHPTEGCDSKGIMNAKFSKYKGIKTITLVNKHSGQKVCLVTEGENEETSAENPNCGSRLHLETRDREEQKMPTAEDVKDPVFDQSGDAQFSLTINGESCPADHYLLKRGGTWQVKNPDGGSCTDKDFLKIKTHKYEGEVITQLITRAETNDLGEIDKNQTEDEYGILWFNEDYGVKHLKWGRKRWTLVDGDGNEIPKDGFKLRFGKEDGVRTATLVEIIPERTICWITSSMEKDKDGFQHCGANVHLDVRRESARNSTED